MNFKDVTSKLNQISVQQAGEWLGVTLPRSGSLRCPFPDHEDKNPSFEVRRCGLRWKCHACDRRGGTIDFVRFYRRIDFREAKQWLLDRSENPQAAVARRFKAPSPTQRISAPLPTDLDTEVYEAFLTNCPLGDTGRAYLHSRAFTDATIDHFRVGQMPSGNLASSMAAEFGFQRLMAAGLLSKVSTAGNFRLTFRPGYLVFPIIEAGRIVSLQARQTQSIGSGPKYLYLTGKRPQTYNLDVLGSDAREIAICEGIPDTMSAHQLRFRAIGLLGVSNALQEDEILRLLGRRIVLLLDWDLKGETKAQKLRSELASRGVVCVRKNRPNPHVKDLNEYLMLRGHDVAV
ncbi:toprim domain-containing protein [Rhizobium sp. BK456]|uniref:toprim domain-containing protein n=1 Tax=Rhizobium sp. BK456 TaxID=2587007 RepID=UPI00161CE188|nr:toprim domain-containing protein [Rhizobium sp. BK456]MBB3524155.1 DNA primase [Rhizobium sp. BK456]